MSAKKMRGKLSKAAKEKLQKAEEERRQREEESRLLAEQEEQRRLEEEEKEKEEQRRLELKDRERREDELRELRHLLEEKQNAVRKWEEECRAKAKWDRYMRCDGSPDPSVAQQINTFINLQEEDADIQIGPVLASCSLAIQLIEELEDLSCDRPQTEESEEVAHRHWETILSLQGLIRSKLNQATEEMLKSSSTNTDIETGNIQTVVQGGSIILCLWANLNKNPRFKGYQFQEVGLGFELPKQLAVSDVAVRILHTSFDHLSHLSRRAQNASRGSMKLERFCPPCPEPGQEGEEETGQEGGMEESAQRSTEDVQSVRSEGRKTAVSTASNKDRQRSTALKEPKEEAEEEQREETNGDGLQDETTTGSKKHSFPLQDLATVTMEMNVFDLQQYTPLGGVFYFDAFRLPPRAHLINGWEMREILDTGLQPFPYPLDQCRLQSATSGSLDDSGVLASPPIGVTVTLPDSIVFLEDPVVARWDPVGCHWRRDCISDITYNKTSESISFHMDSFYAFTLLQDTYVNMPFQTWELRPLGPNSALLTITAAITEVSIEVKEHECALTSVIGSDLPHVLGRWMRPAALQRIMSRSGVNVFVNDYSDEYVSINAKDPLTERGAYEQMAVLSSAVAFSWSRWNAHCGQEHLVLQACEHLQAAPVPEGLWSLYMLGAERSQQLQMEEESESFSATLGTGSEFHSTFLHMLQDGMSEGGRSRAYGASPLFFDCVLQLLLATRVLTYS